MKRLLFISLLALFFATCEKSDNAPDEQLPDCVVQIIEDDTGDWTAAFERSIGDVKFFYFRAGCCDRFNILFDEDCNEICAPDGGFTGGGDGGCPDFSGPFSEDIMIWERE